MNGSCPRLRHLFWMLALGACEEGEKPPVTASAAPSVQASIVAPPPAPPPAPADIDATPLVEQLRCPNRQTEGACRVIESFQKADAWAWKRPAREARWVGYVYDVTQGVETREIVILFAKEIPTAQAAPGALPVRAGTGTFPERLMAHADRLVRARAQRSGPSPRNQAPRFLDAFEPDKLWNVVDTDGPSVLTVEADTAYIRELDRTVYYAQPDATSPAKPGDGRYAELWIATW